MAGLILVALAFFAYVVTDLTEARSQRGLARELVKKLELARVVSGLGGDAAVPAPPPERGDPVARLEIPSLGLSKVVVEGTRSVDTKHGPGHHRGTAFPGRPGNAVIAGHRTTYGAPFRHLEDLRKGSAVVVVTPEGRFRFKVVRNYTVEPGARDVLGPTNDTRLTLVTASPPYQASERRVVVASLEGDPVPPRADAGPVTDLAPDETGLKRDPTAWAGVVVWGELLLVAVAGAVVLYRRWPRWSVWLATTPTLVALAFLSFESLNRLLPSTL